MFFTRLLVRLHTYEEIAASVTLLGPQSRFGDKPVIVRELCPQIWECGAKRVKRAHV